MPSFDSSITLGSFAAILVYAKTEQIFVRKRPFVPKMGNRYAIPRASWRLLRCKNQYAARRKMMDNPPIGYLTIDAYRTS
jgi:hypothetical protein